MRTGSASGLTLPASLLCSDDTPAPDPATCVCFQLFHRDCTSADARGGAGSASDTAPADCERSMPIGVNTTGDGMLVDPGRRLNFISLLKRTRCGASDGECDGERDPPLFEVHGRRAERARAEEEKEEGVAELPGFAPIGP